MAYDPYFCNVHVVVCLVVYAAVFVHVMLLLVGWLCEALISLYM